MYMLPCIAYTKLPSLLHINISLDINLLLYLLLYLEDCRYKRMEEKLKWCMGEKIDGKENSHFNRKYRYDME